MLAFAALAWTLASGPAARAESGTGGFVANCPRGTTAVHDPSGGMRPYRCLGDAGGAWKYARYSDPTIAFEYPEGWTLEPPGNGRRGWCRLTLYRGHPWFQPLSVSGWNEIQIEFLDNALRRKGLLEEGVRDDAVSSFADYLRGRDCTPPAAPAKMYPPAFSIDECEAPLGTVPVGGGITGRLYQSKNRRPSSDPAFNRVLNQVAVLFALPGDRNWLYRVSYFGPGDEFDRYWPAFRRLLASLRPTPGAAPTCGRPDSGRGANEDGGPAEAPVRTDGAVPLLR